MAKERTLLHLVSSYHNNGLHIETLRIAVSNAKTFRRPHPANRSRTYRPVSASSGAETPPLSIADDSSQSGGSQSSIDLSQLNVLLTSASYPASRHRRARARGQGHRRRISQAQVSHVSAYETIQEEVPGLSNTSSPAKATLPNHEKSVLNDITTSVSTMEPEIHIVQWDEEENGMILRKYYAWEDEAQITLQESKRMWEDTPFSLFALQCKLLSSLLVSTKLLCSFQPSEASYRHEGAIGTFTKNLWPITS